MVTAAAKAPVKRRHTFIDPSIGVRLLEARTKAGISQRDLCKDTPFTAAYVSRIESGDRTPSVRAIRIWASKLHVSAAWLETGQDVVDVRMSLRDAGELCEWLASFDGQPTVWMTEPWRLLGSVRDALGVEAPEVVRGLA